VVLGRSEFSIAKIKRKLLGSANPRFKSGWDKPSKELAYFLGSICSDLGVYATHIAITQMYSNAEMIDHLIEIIPKIFGLVPHKSLHKVDVNGVLTDYSQLTVSSNQFLKCLGTEEGIAHGNIRGPSGEWIDFIINKFSWVFDDSFLWYYLGGLYDGDGCLARKKSNSMSCGIWHAVSIGITPEKSRRKIISALDKGGFNFVEETDRGKCYQIVLRGSQDDVDRFLGLIKSRITRKRVK
jgi:hypothetical protein